MEIEDKTGYTTVKHVSSGQILDIKISLPPLKEQNRIAKKLETQMGIINAARVAAEAQLEAAKALPMAYLRAVFNSPAVKKWPRKKLGEVISISARIVDPKIPEYGNLPHVNGENIDSGTGRLLYLHTAIEEKMTSGKYLFDKGCVLYSKLRPYLRKVAYADFKGLCSADMYPIETDRKSLDPRFLIWILLSNDFTRYADEESRRARMPKLNRDQLFNWASPIPPLSTQQKIAEELDAHMTGSQKLTEQIRSQVNELERLPSAILRRAFNGDF
jgi:type I restriction enzyme S subunit